MIPLYEPYRTEHAIKFVTEALETGWVSSSSAQVSEFEKQIAQLTGASHAVATQSGTSALHLGLLLIGVKEGDIVILPNLTFVASANAVKYIGAIPVLIDVRPDTWLLDTILLEQFLEERTQIQNNQCIHIESGRRVAAIMPVHILGNICDMLRMMSLSRQYNIPIIEDAAEALGSTYDGKHAGTFGDIACLSFNGNKIITTGGGGMILTENAEIARRARYLSTQAKEPVRDYFHNEIGFNYRMSGINAALGLAQLELFTEILAKKNIHARSYRKQSQEILPQARWQKINPMGESNFWLNTILIPNSEMVQKHLDKSGIQTRKLWAPLHRLPMYKGSIYIQKNNQSELIYNKSLSLPSSASLTPDDITLVLGSIANVP